ncbi:MAG: ABC transporter permease [Saccharofermentanales bacterium]|jgi:simple sugar transport system permease protein|nr:ABC transporter permease [Eubacteriales bacterium]MDD3611780.1 ABC transporter permease [Eubacteriales bacterium]HHU04203.1 ABC transporter permease [Fastidiosipila sp.]
MRARQKLRSLLSPILIPFISIALTLIVATVIVLLLGKNPLDVFLGFLRGSGLALKPRYGGGQGLLTDLFSYLAILTPMIFGSLAVMTGMRAGLFNIGVAGQMLFPAFLATVLVGYSDLPTVIAWPLIIVIALVVGSAMGAFIGFLKHRFNIHEVVTSIMLNYIVSYITGFFINTNYVDPLTRNSRPVNAATRLIISSSTGEGGDLVRFDIPVGLILAVIVVFIMRYILDRTTVGFRINAVGLNKYAARYAGINVGRNVVLAMAISGALAGLAGVTYYLGFTNNMVPKQLAGLGYDSIAVAVLGNISPIGSLFASILVTIFQKGSIYMGSNVGVPQEIASFITGVLLMFSASGEYIGMKIQNIKRRWRVHRGDASELEMMEE